MTDAPSPSPSPSPTRARALSNTHARYGTIAKAFHWTVAAGILVMIPLGLLANDWPYATSEELAVKARLFSIHKTLGVTVLIVAVARVLWALAQPRPGHLHPERRVETLLADTVHWLLYASLIAVPAAGWVGHAASEGFAPIWWPLGQSLPLVPKSEALREIAGALHVVLGRVLTASLLLHVAGALKHHLWDRDATLRRMAPGRPALPPVAPRRAAPATPFAAPVAAAGVLALALGAGGALGLYAPQAPSAEPAAEPAADPVAGAATVPPPEDAAPRAAAPAQASAGAGGWTVEGGSLGLAVSQLGSRVEGRFADWSAAVAFEEAPDEEGRHGAVEASVEVGSLTLGSVTAQALGAGFLDAGAFPRAVFRAAILAAPAGSEAGYVADGTLSLRGVEVPVTLPFALTIEGDRARMEGIAVVDRRDFAIGQSYADPGTLGFEVEIPVALEAVRGR